MRRSILTLLLIYVMLGLVGAVMLENALHIRPQFRKVALEAEARRIAGDSLQDVEVKATDGLSLRGWYARPSNFIGSSVVLLHGVSATRSQMLTYAPMFLRKGYAVLMPDFRGHGASGGDVITYGVRESRDVPRWADWLLSAGGAQKLYGLGLSLGGSVLIQSLDVEKRFRAIAAEGAYSSFWEVGRDRVLPPSLPKALASVVFFPIGVGAFTYANIRYGFDLDQAAPYRSLQHAHTPTLLIHGDHDFETPLDHSERLAHVNPESTVLWVVPDAKHVGAFTTARAEFERRVTQWFEEHR
ncbi:MAG TPA: alpha/beta fold hydrolase [Bryobacteraceae bacterium]|nr:alpha/beta fold hydrolase [Bryobacteraceae bacterium]